MILEDTCIFPYFQYTLKPIGFGFNNSSTVSTNSSILRNQPGISYAFDQTNKLCK